MGRQGRVYVGGNFPEKSRLLGLSLAMPLPDEGKLLYLGECSAKMKLLLKRHGSSLDSKRAKDWPVRKSREKLIISHESCHELVF